LTYWVPNPDDPTQPPVRVRVSTKTSDLAEAEALRAAKEHEVGASRLGFLALATPVQFNLTVNQCLDLIEANFRLKKNRSWDTTRCHVDLARQGWGHYKALAVTAADVKTVMLRLLQDYKPATVNRAMAYLFRAFRLAVEDRLLPRIPECVAIVDALPEHNMKQGFFERWEYEALRTELAPDLQDMLDWFYWTGWRVSEVRSLSWQSFNAESWTLRLEAENAKGQKFVRDIPAYWNGKPTPLLAILQRRLAARVEGCPYVFHQGGIKVGDFRKAWNSAWVRAKLPLYLSPTRNDPTRMAPRSPHDFRRTVVRNLTLAGVDRKFIKLITGHRTDKMIDRYIPVMPSDAGMALAKGADYFKTLPKTRPGATVVPIRKAQMGR
jgi:integrase